jgi:hypothetical protein
VQVDPIKPKLKPPGFKRLKRKCDVLLSTSAFRFNVRRFTMAREMAERRGGDPHGHYNNMMGVHCAQGVPGVLQQDLPKVRFKT